MYYYKLLYILFLIKNIYNNAIIIFIHPSTLFNIHSEIFFPAIQNLQKSGLHKIDEHTLSKRSYNQVFLPFLNNYNSLFKDNTIFYIFSWGGTIYPIKTKEEQSYNLYLNLINIIAQYPNYKIILIGCSHGGSVILGMSKYLQSNNIKIELIILLGTPINNKNNEYAQYKNKNNQYCFNKIINIYSENDYIQKMDIFFNNYNFCSSMLADRENLINYKIKNYGHINLWHKIFNYDPFIIQLPQLLYELNNNK